MRREPKLFSGKQATPAETEAQDPRLEAAPAHEPMMAPAPPPPVPPAMEAEAESGGERRRFPVMWLVLLLVLGGVAFGGWKGFQMLQDTPTASAEVPLFAADTEAYKVEPEDPGGLEVDNEGTLILEETLTGEVADDFEVLLPEPEEPIAIKAEAFEGDGVIDVEAAPVVVSEPIFSADEVTTLVDEVMTEATNAVPSGLPIPGAKPEPPAEAPPEFAEFVVEEEALVARPEVASETGLSFDDVAASLGSANADSAGVPEPGAPEGPAEEVASGASLPEGPGVARVQIAAYSTRDAADAAWERLYRNNTDLLGDTSALIVEAVIAGTSFFRLQVGAYETKAGAETLCASLKQRDIDCLVVGP